MNCHCIQTNTRLWPLLILSLLLTGCSSLELETCAPDISKLGAGDVPRMRNSKVRIQFADMHRVAQKLVPYAAFADQVYYDLKTDCADPGRQLPEDPERRANELKHRAHLQEIIEKGGWVRVKEFVPSCNDEMGLFFGAWYKKGTERHQIILSFRGTENTSFKDWIYGNFRWVTRWTDYNQYPGSRKQVLIFMKNVKKHLLTDGLPIDYFTVGHSLGGGLAQNILYAYPKDVKQAFVFDPSPVTMYTDQNDSPDNQKTACNCLEGSREAKIYRIYESGEILGFVRYPLKLGLNLNRHIHEIRLDFDKGNPLGQHSMASMFEQFYDLVPEKPVPADDGTPWYQAKNTAEDKDCTGVFEESQKKFCGAKNDKDYCPGF